MTNPLTTTRPIICALRDASDPAKRESHTVPLWENLLTEYMIRPNRELALNSQQPIDDTLKKVDLMVRYYDTLNTATALFLIECKRNKQKQYDIRQLEEQLNAYLAYLFLEDGVARNQITVYSAVAFGSLIRIYRISLENSSTIQKFVDIRPIWGGKPYDVSCYKDVRVIADAHQILLSFKEIASLGNYTLGTTSTGNPTRLPSLSSPTDKLRTSIQLPKITSLGSMVSNIPQSTAGPSFLPTNGNLVGLEKHIDVNGKGYYSWTMPDGNNLTEWVVSSNWKEVTPSTGLSYFRNLDRGVWSRGCDDKSNQVLVKETEGGIQDDEVEQDEAEGEEAENDDAEDQAFTPTLENEVDLKKITTLAGKLYVWRRGKISYEERVKVSRWEKILPANGNAYFQNLKYQVWARTCK